MNNVVPFKTKSEMAIDAYEAYAAIVRETPAADMTFDLAKQAAKHWSRFLALCHEEDAEKIDRLLTEPFGAGGGARS